MCCFSQPVQDVSDTSIFARSEKGIQFLVYRMTYRAAAELAMVLPIPVPARPREDAVRFISLASYPKFFRDMHGGFPAAGATTSEVLSLLPTPVLKVYDVGSYEASFVPTLNDFGRLDERFRIPRATWAQLPMYADYGFAVFKLKATSDKPGGVHPMAFAFPQRDPARLFFPTVHIHDGQVHPEAEFDHTLFCQVNGDALYSRREWEHSRSVAREFMQLDLAGDIVAGKRRVWRRRLEGDLPNQDTWV